MLFELLSDENREINYSPHALPAQQKFLIPGSSAFTASGSFGSMLFQEIDGTDFQIHYSNYLLWEPASFRSRSEYSLLELQFCMQTDAEYHLTGIGDVKMKRNSYNMIYIPFTENKVRFQDQRYTTFDIHFSLEFLIRMAPHFPILAKFLERIDLQKAGQIFPLFLPATKEMMSIIHSVIHYKKEGIIKAFFLEARVKELLLLVMEHSYGPDPAPELVLRPDDIERIHAAREVLMNRMDNPPTLKELARLVGLNEFKLKKGYKQIYNTTMYLEFREERLKKALLLLKDESHTISEVAFLAGFKGISSFCVSFHNRFGYSPNYYRKSP